MGLFLGGQKELGEETGNEFYDGMKEWSDILAIEIILWGASNPRFWENVYNKLFPQSVGGTTNVPVEQRLESAGSIEGDATHNDAKSFLQRALNNQGLDEAPNALKEVWIDGDYRYVVRIHEGNSKYTDASVIYRVSRQGILRDANGQGTGIEYLGADGIWYHQSVLVEFFRDGTPNPDFNEAAARATHIVLKEGN